MTAPRILFAIDTFDDDDIVELVAEHGPTAVAAWIAVLCGAKRGAGEFGARWAVLARRIGADKRDVQRVVEHMQLLGLVALKHDPDNAGARIAVTNWERYQVDPTSTRRMREHRARKRAEEAAEAPEPAPEASVETRSVSRHVTSRNVTQRIGDGEQNIRTTEALRASAEASPERAPGTRAPNPLWDALIAELDIDIDTITKSGRGAINRALSELRAVNATPDQIRHRATQHRHRWPQITLTATSLAKHWATLEPHHPEHPTPPTSPDQIDAAIAALPVDPTGFLTRNRNGTHPPTD